MNEKDTEQTDEETVITDPSSEETDEETEDKGSSQEIDYVAELEAEKKRGKPDPEIAKKAFKEREEARKKKEQNEEDETDEEEDIPLTRKDIQTMRSEVRREIYADRISELATGLSSSEAEANLVVEIHKNRVFPDSMSLKEQVEEAWVIANRKKLMAKNRELSRALLSKQTSLHSSATPTRDRMEGTAPKMNAQDEASYKRAGFIYESKSRLWKKKLPNGTFLVKDPKTKKSWTAK